VISDGSRICETIPKSLRSLYTRSTGFVIAQWRPSWIATNETGDHNEDPLPGGRTFSVGGSSSRL